MSTTTPSKTWTVRMTRAFLAVFFVWNLAWGIFDLSSGHAFGLISLVAVVALASAMVYQTRVIRRIEHQNRPHPDYIAIARMEREVYGETFEHDGAPQDGRGPIASTLLPKDRDPSVWLMCRLGHETRVRGTMPPRTCPVCDEQRRERRAPAAPGPARSGTSTVVYTAGGVAAPGGGAGGDSFWLHIEEARRLTGQIKAADDGDHRSNLRWERPS